MSLEDLLNKDQNDQEELKRKTLELKIAQKEREEKFESDVKVCFAEIINPSVEEIIKLFKSKGHKANYGQDLQRIHFTSSVSTVSFCIGFRNCVMQIDITSTKALTRVDFKRQINNRQGMDKTQSFSIDEISKISLDKFVEDGVADMMKHCK